MWAEEIQRRRGLQTFGEGIGGEFHPVRAASTFLVALSIRSCAGSSWVLISEPASSQSDHGHRRVTSPSSPGWDVAKQDLRYACEMTYSLSLLPNLCLWDYDSSHPIARKGHARDHPAPGGCLHAELGLVPRISDSQPNEEGRVAVGTAGRGELEKSSGWGEWLGMGVRLFHQLLSARVLPESPEP